MNIDGKKQLPSVESINAAIKDVDSNLVSDGYHTFGELYEHRIALFMALCYYLDGVLTEAGTSDLNTIWMSKKHSDGTEWEGWFILGINQEPGKQITYHLPMSKWPECSRLGEILEQAPPYDGHTAADVLERLNKLIFERNF